MSVRQATQSRVIGRVRQKAFGSLGDQSRFFTRIVAIARTGKRVIRQARAALG